MVWIKASLSAFSKYGIDIKTQRRMPDGDYILHVELSDLPMFLLKVRFDEQIKILLSSDLEGMFPSEFEGGV